MDFAKEIAPLFEGILVEDLTLTESRIVNMLVKLDLIFIEDEDVPTVRTKN